MTEFTDDFNCGVPLNLPPAKTYDSSVDHAPKRPAVLDKKQRKQAIANALRYFPSEWHEELALEFSAELDEYGHIYMYRFRPDYEMYARPLEEYPYVDQKAACIMLMIQNNLDPNVAQYPHELVTYGGNGSVFHCHSMCSVHSFQLSGVTHPNRCSTDRHLPPHRVLCLCSFCARCCVYTRYILYMC